MLFVHLLTYKTIDCSFCGIGLTIFKMMILTTGLQGELIKATTQSKLKF